MGQEAEAIAVRHKMMTELLVMALACDQTRVFQHGLHQRELLDHQAGLREAAPHDDARRAGGHARVGYQPTASWFTRRAMESWAYFVDAFTKVKEGNGTLLDNVFIMATTDHGYARVHSLDHIPIFTAAARAARCCTGLHIDGKGTTGCRVGYTALTPDGRGQAVVGREQQQHVAGNRRDSRLSHELTLRICSTHSPQIASRGARG